MIWLLLGMLFFGGGANGDLTRPLVRVEVMRAAIEGVVTDAATRARATATLDGMAAESATVASVLKAYSTRLVELDAHAAMDRAAYRAALDRALDEIDAVEQRLLQGRNELRAMLTDAQWRELSQNLPGK